jgi:phytanoyl-CoA hydroxylase
MLRAEHFDSYHLNGFAHIEAALSPQLLEKAREIIEPWVNFQIQEWQRQGLIKDDYRNFDFWHRLLVAWRAAGKPMFRRRPNRFLINREMFAFLHSRELLSIAESVIGTAELSVHGIFNARPQLPEAGWAETPFHQDSQYWHLNYGAPEPDTERRTHVMTMWIPLQPVDELTGGLQLLSKKDTGDQIFDIRDYDFGKTGFLGLKPEDVWRHPIFCPAMKPGDILIFNQRTPHGAAPNLAHHVRWSIDIRYEATRTATTVGQRFGFVAQSVNPANETTFEDWQRKANAVS